jgi:hypothetical protein
MDRLKHHRESARAFFAGVLSASSRIIATGLASVEVKMEEADFVFPGRVFRIVAPTGNYSFWLGINGRRLIFVAHMLKIDPDIGRKYFAHCFNESVNWQPEYQLLRGNLGLALTARCTIEHGQDLVQEQKTGLHGDAAYEITDVGVIWANEVAFLAQAWLAACERDSVQSHPDTPRPF